MLKNYKRLALINTGQYGMDHYHEYTRQAATRFALRYEEIDGSKAMVKKLISGDWDDEFVVVQPGDTIRLQDFYPQ